MPAKIEDPNFVEQIKWISALPKEGGEWGKGITNTVCELQASVQHMEMQKADLDAQKVELSGLIGRQRKLLRTMAAKAEKECTMLFSNAQIAEAKKAVEEDPTAA